MVKEGDYLTKEEFKKFYLALVGFYPNQVQKDSEIQKLWYEEIKNLDYTTVCQGLKCWVAENKWQPTISDIIDFTMGKQSTPEEAWNYVVMYINDSSNVIRLNDDYIYGSKFKAILKQSEFLMNNNEYIPIEYHSYHDRETCSTKHYYHSFIKRIPDEYIECAIEKVASYRKLKNFLDSYNCIEDCYEPSMRPKVMMEYKELKQQFITCYKDIISKKRIELIGIKYNGSKLIEQINDNNEVNETRMLLEKIEQEEQEELEKNKQRESKYNEDGWTDWMGG